MSEMANRFTYWDVSTTYASHRAVGSSLPVGCRRIDTPTSTAAASPSYTEQRTRGVGHPGYEMREAPHRVEPCPASTLAVLLNSLNDSQRNALRVGVIAQVVSRN